MNVLVEKIKPNRISLSEVNSYNFFIIPSVETFHKHVYMKLEPVPDIDEWSDYPSENPKMIPVLDFVELHDEHIESELENNLMVELVYLDTIKFVY